MFRLKLANGLTIETDITNTELWERMINRYSAINPHYGPDELWECPWCGGAIDHSSSEQLPPDGIDTYRCVGSCELLISHVTPIQYTTYADVPLSKWRVIVESVFSNWSPPDDAIVPTVKEDES